MHIESHVPSPFKICDLTKLSIGKVVNCISKKQSLLEKTKRNGR